MKHGIFWFAFLQLTPFRGVKSGNARLARDIVAWTFQENLVLRIDKVEHHKINTTESSEQYTVNDQLVSFFEVFKPPLTTNC